MLVEGRRGAIELRLDNTLKITTPEEEEVRDCRNWPRYGWVSPADEALHDGDCIHSIVAYNRHLLASLHAGVAPETSGEHALKTLQVVFATIESAERDEAVRCSQARLPTQNAIH